MRKYYKKKSKLSKNFQNWFKDNFDKTYNLSVGDGAFVGDFVGEAGVSLLPRNLRELRPADSPSRTTSLALPNLAVMPELMDDAS